MAELTDSYGYVCDEEDDSDDLHGYVGDVASDSDDNVYGAHNDDEASADGAYNQASDSADADNDGYLVDEDSDDQEDDGGYVGVEEENSSSSEAQSQPQNDQRKSTAAAENSSYVNSGYGEMVKDQVSKEAYEKAEMAQEDFWAKFYWNSSFQKLMERPTSTPEEFRIRREKLRQLLDSFVALAEPIVKTIVRERNVDAAERTIKPIDIGGVAGGLKFLQSNFFFKFACDQGAISLYGGEHEAQKAATHELRSLNALMSCNTTSLCVPLMCVCTYLGWRVIVVSKLPIGSESLVYGSADAGRTIFSDSDFHALIGNCANKLGLKLHGAQDNQGQLHELYGPVDLEGHKGVDRRFYTIDAARLFAPVQPLKGLGPSVLYRLFRPEFQAEHGPLSSDCYTGFGNHQRKIHNRESRHATKKLENEIIPQFAESVTPQKLVDVKSALHARGINMRYCGMVLAQTPDPECRRILLTEMLARGLRNELFVYLRSISSNQHEEAVAQFITKFSVTFIPNKVLAKYFMFCRESSVVDAVIATAIAGTPVVDMRAVLARGLDLAGVETSSLDPVVVTGIRVLVKTLEVEDATPPSFEEQESFLQRSIAERSTGNGLEGVEQLINLASLYFGTRGYLSKANETMERALSEVSSRRGENSLEVAEVREIQARFLIHTDVPATRKLLEQVLTVKAKYRADTTPALWLSFNAALMARDLSAASEFLKSMESVKQNPALEHNKLKFDVLRGTDVDPEAFHRLASQLPIGSQRASCLKSEAELLLAMGAQGAALQLLNQVEKEEIQCFGAESFARAETLSLMARCDDQQSFDESLEMVKSLCGNTLDERAAVVVWNTLGDPALLTQLLGKEPEDSAVYPSSFSLLPPPENPMAFQLHALSPNMKQLLSASGVTHKELLDPEKATIVFTQLLQKFENFDKVAEATASATKEFTKELRKKLDDVALKSSFLQRKSQILGYSDTHDQWAQLKALNLDDHSDRQIAMVGQLHKWVSGGNVVTDQQLLLVRVGYDPGWFHVYTVAELDEVAASGQTLIYQNSIKHTTYSRAEWIIKDDKLAGIRLSVKVGCDQQPSISDVFFSRFPTLTCGKVVVIRRGSADRLEKRSDAPIGNFFANVQKLPDLSSVSRRPARDDFPTIGCKSGGLELFMSSPLAPNERIAPGVDRFGFRISLVNSGNTKYFFSSLKVEYKLLNDDSWAHAANLFWESGSSPFPVVSDPGANHFAGVVMLPFFDQTKKHTRPPFNHSLIARHKRLRVRFTLVGTKGPLQVSRIFEYVESLPKLSEDPRAFLSIDDFVNVRRHSFLIYPNRKSKKIGALPLSTNFGRLDVATARQIVWDARKKNEVEWELDWSSKKTGFSAKFFALIDSNANRIYAIKCQLILDSGVGVQKYLPIEFYGDDDAGSVPARPAREVAKLPVISETDFVLPSLDYEDEGKDDPISVVEVDAEDPQPNVSPSQDSAESNSAAEHQADEKLSERADGGQAKEISTNVDLSTLTESLVRTNQAIVQYIAAEMQAEAKGHSPDELSSSELRLLDRINTAMGQLIALKSKK